MNLYFSLDWSSFAYITLCIELKDLRIIYIKKYFRLESKSNVMYNQFNLEPPLWIKRQDCFYHILVT